MMIQWRWRINTSLLRGAWRVVVTTLASLLLASVAAAQSAVPAKLDLPARIADSDQLRGGWYPWDPYQYRGRARSSAIHRGAKIHPSGQLRNRRSWEIAASGYSAVQQRLFARERTSDAFE
jgi:hypothetical protein